MEYPDEFEKEFTQRTLSIVRQYQGAFDATLLINCLVGLLIIPKERSLNRIPEIPITQLGEWGVSPSCIKSFGGVGQGIQTSFTLRDVVRKLRNSVAHFRIIPMSLNKQCIAFNFKDNGFEAEIPVQEMRDFVERLAIFVNELS